MELIIEHLINRRIGVGVVEGPLSDETWVSLAKEGIKAKRITSGELVLVVPNNEIWENISHVSLDSDFRKLPFILRGKGSGIRTWTLTLSGSM